MNYKITIGLGISLMASLGAMDAEVLSLDSEETDELMQVTEEPVVITDEDYALLEPHLDPCTVFALTLQYKELPYTFTVLDRRGYELILGALRENKAAFSGLLTRLAEAHNYDDFCRGVQAASFLGVNELMDQLYTKIGQSPKGLLLKDRKLLKALLQLQVRYPDLMILDVNYNKKFITRWPLMAFGVSEKDEELFNLLLQSGADVNICLPVVEFFLIIHAILNRNRVGVRWLIKAGANLHPAGRDSVLKEAINQGATLKMVKFLLERGGYAEDALECARVEWPRVVELLEKYKPKE